MNGAAAGFRKTRWHRTAASRIGTRVGKCKQKCLSEMVPRHACAFADVQNGLVCPVENRSVFPGYQTSCPGWEYMKRLENYYLASAEMLLIATIDKNRVRCFEQTQNNFENSFWHE